MIQIFQPDVHAEELATIKQVFASQWFAESDYGLYTTFLYHPLHRVTAYRNSKNLPAAESAADRTLLLPAHHGLSAEELEQVIELTYSFAPGRR